MRKELAENQMKKEMDDVRVLLDQSQAALYVLQKEQFSYASSMTAHLLGYDNSGELIGKSFWEMIHPDDQNKINPGQEGDPSQGFSAPHIFRLVRKDGTICWVSMGGGITAYQGKPANVGHLIDLTSFKEMEKSLQNSLEKYQTILNEIDDSVGEVDLKGNITYTNDAGCRIYGHSREEAIGRNYRSFVAEEYVQNVYQAYNKVFRTGIPGKNIIYELIRKNDGNQRIVEDYISLIRNTDGVPTGFRTVSRDITDRKEAEKNWPNIVAGWRPFSGASRMPL